MLANMLNDSEERRLRRLIKSDLARRYGDEAYDEMEDYIDDSIEESALCLDRLAMWLACRDTQSIDNAINQYRNYMASFSLNKPYFELAKETIKSRIYSVCKSIWNEQFDLFGDL